MGRAQPGAARGGLREDTRARQGLARVASVGRTSVQVGLIAGPPPKLGVVSGPCRRATPAPAYWGKHFDVLGVLGLLEFVGERHPTAH